MATCEPIKLDVKQMTTEHSSKAMIAGKDIFTTKFEVHSLKNLFLKITQDSYVSLQPRL